MRRSLRGRHGSAAADRLERKAGAGARHEEVQEGGLLKDRTAAGAKANIRSINYIKLV